MEIFIATSIKSFDLNPRATKVSFHTSATQQIERSARAAVYEVGDELQKSASSEQDKLAGGKQYVARAESSCEFLWQETTSAEKRFMKQPQRLGDDFEFAFGCNAPPAWKFCAAQSQERFERKCSESGSSVKMTKGFSAFLIAGSGSCGSPKQRRGHEKHARAGGNEPGTTRGRATARPQKLRRGPAAPAARARARGPDPESAQV